MSGVPDLAATVAAALGHPARPVEVLAEVPGERLVARVACGPTTVVAKWSADQSWSLGARVQRALGPALDHADSVVVPIVLSADRASGVSVTTDLGETTLADPAAATAERLELAGRAVAEVHAADSGGPLAPRATTMADHLTDLVAPHPLVLADQAPHWAPVIHAALDHLALVSTSIAHAPVTFIHRDLNLRNLLVVPAGPDRCSDGIGIVDWDLAALGDPVFDVAYLLAHLETHGADPALGLAFASGYRSLPTGAAALDHPGAAERLAAYRIFNLVRRACRRHRLADAGWLTERDRMLTLVAGALGVPLPSGTPA